MKNRVVLAGGSGFLGMHLAKRFIDEGWDVDILSRQPGSANSRVRNWLWDGKTIGAWTEALEGATAIVNMTGKNVNCRYNAVNRREIISSRVDSVRVLAEARGQLKNPPMIWLQAGTLAIYGDAGDRVCDENAPHGVGFSVDVCEAREKAFAEVKAKGLRKSLLRIGFVLSPGEGAMKPLEMLTRNFLGGTVGSGKQFISWIHIDDLVEMMWQACTDPKVEGTYNATGPLPVTNAEFMAKLRAALGRPWSPPAPAPAIYIGAWYMGSEAELALTGRRCMPRRFMDQGFHFKHWDLRDTLGQLYPEAA